MCPLPQTQAHSSTGKCMMHMSRGGQDKGGGEGGVWGWGEGEGEGGMKGEERAG